MTSNENVLKIVSINLDLLIKSGNGMVEKLAEAGAVSRQTIYSYTKGSLPNSSVVALWIKKLGLNPIWLFSGNGDMFTSAARSASADDAKDVELELLRENRELLKENRELLKENRELRSELDRLRQQQIETANTGEIPVRSGKPAHTSPDGMSSK